MTRGSLTVGVVNNLPDRAMAETETTFRTLLDAAAPGRAVRIEWCSLPELPREGLARLRVEAGYRALDTLLRLPLDGLIVTGAEPRTGVLDQEPFWPSITALADHALARGIPTIWSCLAAQAAALHLDGVQRQPRPFKVSGVFACTRAAEDPLTRGFPARWHTPHSRQYELPEAPLAARGYRVVSRAGAAGVDCFVRDGDAPFLFLQGHPEYDETALRREYLRDAGRYLRGEQARYPDTPTDYFQPDTEAALTAIRARADRTRAEPLLAEVRQVAQAPGSLRPFHSQAVPLFANWLRTLGAAAPRERALAGSPVP